VPTNDCRVHDGLLTVKQTSDGARLRLSLAGEMDLSSADTAATMLAEALASGRRLFVDLAELEFIDSAGIAMLVRAIQQADPERLWFLASRHEAVRRVLGLTGVEERMNLVAEADFARLSAPVEPSASPAGAGALLPAA
jgi:anti-sigma B factor antagonist